MGLTQSEIRAQIEAVKASIPIVRPMERLGRTAYFPDLDGCPEWLAGSTISYPSEKMALEAAEERKEYVLRKLEDHLAEIVASTVEPLEVGEAHSA
jgi:hypothetical protein